MRRCGGKSRIILFLFLSLLLPSLYSPNTPPRAAVVLTSLFLPSQALWIHDPSTGEIVSEYFSPSSSSSSSRGAGGSGGEGAVCLTTGWPFLQAGAYPESGSG